MRCLPLALLLAACSRSSSPPPAAPPASAPVAATPAAPPAATPVVGATPGALTLPEHGAVSAGAPVPKGEAESLSAILASPDAYAGKTVLVEGKVRAACAKKGCWMEITPLKDPNAACRVRFKDYGFFVPTNSAGAEARLSGEVKVRTLAAEEVAHLEGEGAHLAKGPDGTARAVEITATGVELMRL